MFQVNATRQIHLTYFDPNTFWNVTQTVGSAYYANSNHINEQKEATHMQKGIISAMLDPYYNV